MKSDWNYQLVLILENTSQLYRQKRDATQVADFAPTMRLFASPHGSILAVKYEGIASIKSTVLSHIPG